ncbi:MAG: helix-turn-helix domain-containing protein [Burkholderiales bacterium]
MNPEQLCAEHHARLAYVYIRQSSLQQVLHHTESQRRQRALVERAVQLGWRPERVQVLDEDLGRSGARTQRRSGFERLLSAVAVGEVGIIFALEASRISRDNRNWYHLLDICAITHTLIADAEGLYDPRAYNDRLLLGLKGTMSEAELHLMQQRLVEAVRAKARRGEFRHRLPAGYDWDEAGRIQKTPDEQLRSMIAQVFARFDELGSIHRVHCALVEQGLRVAVRAGRGAALRWGVPSEGYVSRLLKNPVYAGAYAWGRRQVEERLDAEQRPVKRLRSRAREAWHALIKEHHEGYISWERYERNQCTIESNRRAGAGHPGAAREGVSLLQGLVLCGRCGRSMKVNYQHRGGTLRYVCKNAHRQTGQPLCQGFGAVRLERALEALVLEALEPAALQAMAQASVMHTQTNERERAHTEQHLERLRYEVDLARRQYDAVDPANRLVARELERRWECALEACSRIQTEASARLEALEKPLSVAERVELERFARQLPSLWQASGARVQDQKRIVRCLIENVVVTVCETETLRAQVHWVGGEVSTLEVPKGKSGVHRYVTDPEVVALVRLLAAEFADDQIARILHRKRLKTVKGLAFNAQRVTNIRSRYDIPGHTRAKLGGDEQLYTVEQAAQLLGVSRRTLDNWIASGLLRARQLTQGAPWRVELSEADRRRLAATEAPQGWLTLKHAASALGVSQQTVLNKLKSGALNAVRVRVGARSAWRIAMDSTRYDQQEKLFE